MRGADDPTIEDNAEGAFVNDAQGVVERRPGLGAVTEEFAELVEAEERNGRELDGGSGDRGVCRRC